MLRTGNEYTLLKTNTNKAKQGETAIYIDGITWILLHKIKDPASKTS